MKLGSKFKTDCGFSAFVYFMEVGKFYIQKKKERKKEGRYIKRGSAPVLDVFKENKSNNDNKNQEDRVQRKGRGRRGGMRGWGWGRQGLKTRSFLSH